MVTRSFVFFDVVRCFHKIRWEMCLCQHWQHIKHIDQFLRSETLPATSTPSPRVDPRHALMCEMPETPVSQASYSTPQIKERKITQPIETAKHVRFRRTSWPAVIGSADLEIDCISIWTGSRSACQILADILSVCITIHATLNRSRSTPTSCVFSNECQKNFQTTM